MPLPWTALIMTSGLIACKSSSKPGTKPLKGVLIDLSPIYTLPVVILSIVVHLRVSLGQKPVEILYLLPKAPPVL